MKIAVCSYGPEQHHINAYGGLEVRFAVNWAQFLAEEGHEVYFFDPHGRGVDTSFDLAIDCMMERCDNVKARKHIHTSFSTTSLGAEVVQNSECYQAGNFIYGSPYRVDYLKSLSMSASEGFKHIPAFLPIPYLDSLLPHDMQRGFDRTGISWVNKGNFNSEFGPDCNYHFVTNGIQTLQALVKLNQKADFKITFALDSLIRSTRQEWRGEIEALIGQLRQVERVEILPWTKLIALLTTCKLNTHAGGLTSSVNEALYAGTVPVTPANFIHLGTVAVIPHATETTTKGIYDAYERLWFDEKYYNQINDAFQDHFRDHRTAGVRRAWKNLCQQLDLG